MQLILICIVESIYPDILFEVSSMHPNEISKKVALKMYENNRVKCTLVYDPSTKLRSIYYKSSLNGRKRVNNIFFLIAKASQRTQIPFTNQIVYKSTHQIPSLTKSVTQKVNPSIIYQNDRHIDDSDPNMYTILNFKYDPDKDTKKSELYAYNDINRKRNGQTQYTIEYNYDTLSKFNGQRVSNSFHQSYDVCAPTPLDMNSIDFASISDDESSDLIEKVFPCGVIICDSNSVDNRTLKIKAYNKLKEEIVKNNKKYVYDEILYSNKFLGWIKSLKESHDKILELAKR